MNMVAATLFSPKEKKGESASPPLMWSMECIECFDLICVSLLGGGNPVTQIPRL